MKAGDLVRYKNLQGHIFDGKFISKQWTGLIIEVEKKIKNKKNVLVMWSSGISGIESKESLEVISD